MTAREVLRQAARLPGLGRVAPVVKDFAVNAGVLSYRPPAWEEADIEAHYASGAFDYFADLEEMPRYGILLGYLTFFCQRPRIIDVGCGAGLLRRRIGTVDFEAYLGIDPAPSSIEAAAPLADERTSFVVGDLLRTDVGTYEVAVLNEVLYMAPDPPAVLDRLFQVIEPGGLLLTSMMRHPGDRQLWKEIDARFEPVDAVRVRHETNTVARGGWRMAAHRRTEGRRP